MSAKHYIVYGAGDPATAEIMDLFFQKGIAVELRDIRKDDMNGRENLTLLLHKRLTTIPQVFHPDSTYLGDFEKTEAFLARLPNRKLEGPQAA